MEWEDCHISQSYPCSIFQTEYASKYLSTFTFHHILDPWPLWLACYFLSMDWTFTCPGLCSFSSLQAEIAMPFLTQATHTRLSTSISILVFHYLTDIYLRFPKKINPYLFSATLPYTYIHVFFPFFIHFFIQYMFLDLPCTNNPS